MLQKAWQAKPRLTQPLHHYYHRGEQPNMQSRNSSSNPRSSSPGDSYSSTQHQASSNRWPHGDGGYQHTTPGQYYSSTPRLVVTSHTDGWSNSMGPPWSDGASGHASNFSAVHSVPQTLTGSNDLQGQPTQPQHIGAPAPQDVDPTRLMPPLRRPQGQMQVTNQVAASGRAPQSPAWGNQVSSPCDRSDMSPSMSGSAHSPTQTSTPKPFVSLTPWPTGSMSPNPQLSRLAWLSEANVPAAGPGNAVTQWGPSPYSIGQEVHDSQTTRAPQSSDRTDERGNTSKCSMCHCPQPQGSGDDGRPAACIICGSFLR